ncbi:MAG: conjugal transfer protein TraX [Oculatellaceae cyanobacterium Prado106]|jgi:hypothetical protein|nr:conjugal transfer protein TraX [Oculatellaceae cyanobacterium Prado106]
MQPGFTQYQIKLLAALLMLLDHIGAVLLPDVILLRVLGRLSFPLFAWLLVQGEAHTRNFWRYFLRLLLLGLIAQPIYWFTFGSDRLNILFTLALGLLCLRGVRRFPRLGLLIGVGVGAIAMVLDAEYQWYGIGMILLIQQFRHQWEWWIGWLGLHFIFFAVMPDFGLFQLPALFSPVLFMLATKEQGARARWFYAFYPGHLLVLWGVRDLLVEKLGSFGF